MIQVVPNQPPEAQPIKCPRTGCGTDTEVSRFGLLRTHKLPDGWRTCAASGATPRDAKEFIPPFGYQRPEGE